MEILKRFKANFRKVLKPTILRKFRRKFFLPFGNNLRKCIIVNFEEILKANMRKILRFFMHFENSLEKYVFTNFKEILKAKVRKILSRTIMRKYGVKLFLNFRNNLRKL